jgi:hypothetical protein
MSDPIQAVLSIVDPAGKLIYKVTANQERLRPKNIVT